MRFVLVALALAGCDTLFPELSHTPDASVYDGGSDGGDNSPRLAGGVCVLADVRDYKSCVAGSTGSLRVTVEETRQEVMTDARGAFSLPLSQKLTLATVAVVDANGRFAITVAPVHLASGVAANIALPIVELQTWTNVLFVNGVAADPQKGDLLAWATDGSGAAVGNVTADQAGAFFEGPATNELARAAYTGKRGTVALLGVSPTSVTLGLSPPPTLPLRGDRYPVPIRAGAVTMTALVLAPR